MTDPISLETINRIGNAHLANKINKALSTSSINALALTSDLKIESTEKFLNWPARFKANFRTSLIEEFARYSDEKPQSNVFISQNFEAMAIFDIGTPDEPANREDLAKVTLKKSADYHELMQTNGKTLTQSGFVYWLEEYHANIKVFGKEKMIGSDAPEIKLSDAIHAVRNSKVKIKAETTSKIEDFSEEESAFASIDVENKGNNPVYLDYTCTPYHGLNLPLQTANQQDDDNMERTFRLRISTITKEEKVFFALKILHFEKHTEEMQNAFKEQLKTELNKKTVVRLGEFAKT